MSTSETATAPTFAPGAITDGDIRYVLMRADVLMGVAHELPDDQGKTYLDALEKSVFRYSQRSFERYRSEGRFGTEDFLRKSAEVAARLGWGVWRVSDESRDQFVVDVENSPFAAGHGKSKYPVCAPISGVLRAISLVGYGRRAAVRELLCAAEGNVPCCRFEIRLECVTQRP